MSVNYVAIKKDGRTVTGTAATRRAAIVRMGQMLDDDFYHGELAGYLAKFFVGDENGILTEYIAEDLRRATLTATEINR